MAHIGAGVEYALHCLLHLVPERDEAAPSTRDLADFQGVSPSYVAKLFTKLEKAGVVAAREGVRGGFRLARPAADISFLDVVEAIEGGKPLFECREVRRDCVLYRGAPPDWATRGVCAIHAAILEAERAMRAELGRRTLADVAGGLALKLPDEIRHATGDWFEDRARARRSRGEKGKEK